MDISIKNEFSRMFLAGKYTQKELAKRFGITEKTAGQWVKEMQPLRYFAIRKDLTKTLEELTKQKDYQANADTISRLITDIERVDALIRKAKYIPHLQA